MAIIAVKSLIEAGVHFGHRVSRWNPKMAPYIFGKRNLIHIIDLRETVRGLIRAYHFLKKLSENGDEILIVGTKRQAKTVIRNQAQRSNNIHYVAERWLGGSLTNFSTIRKRLSRLEELEKKDDDGTMAGLSKKLASALRREQRKIQRNLEGIRNMEKLPGAIIIVDPRKEHIAIKEAVKLSIPTICLMDTDSDPDLVDIAIPGNDDAMRSIDVICSKLIDAVVDGHKVWEEKKKIEDAKKKDSKGEYKGDLKDKNKKGKRFPRKKRRDFKKSDRTPYSDNREQDSQTHHTSTESKDAVREIKTPEMKPKQESPETKE